MPKQTKTIIANKSHLPVGRDIGAALLVTLAVLVILTTIVYSLLSRITIYNRRQRYMINYQGARYACDSAMKYALTKVKKINPELITREDSPDFSDLFSLTHEQEQIMLEEWAIIKTQELEIERQENEDDDPFADTTEDSEDFGSMNDNPFDDMGSMMGDEDPNDPNGFGGFGGFSGFGGNSGFLEDGSVDPNSLTIPGPYGFDWPYVSEPLDFKIGNARVTVNIRDENAKMPLTWGLMKDAKLLRASDDAMVSFCEWMQMDYDQIEDFILQLEEVKEQKFYSTNIKPIVTIEKVQQKVRATARRTTSRTSRRSGTTRKPTTRTVSKKKTRPSTGHTSDFARLLHSSLIDTTVLSQPLPDTGDRYESALKYLGLWGSQKVNINTAPRHVLEAVFTFGGDQEEIAEEIIQQRKIEPFKTIAEFKQKNYGFTDSIKKVEPYIITKSRFFAIEVTASCGNAVVSSVATVVIDKGKTSTVGIMSN